ncbi:hypothetical protein RZS08_62655, partial [Arthrospira platensis SPKY1]|nr:hypothetical protein [Arthrospira platensis SPKY1]
TYVGVLMRVTPDPDWIDMANMRLKLSYRMGDGSIKSLSMLYSDFESYRAFAVPSSRLDGRPGLFINNIGVGGENLSPAARGGVWHEGFHVLMREGKIDASDFG